MSAGLLSHPAQDERLTSDEREYARSLSHLLGRELAQKADSFEGYALDSLGCPPDIVYRTLAHGFKHRCAMLAAHFLAQQRDLSDADAEAAIDALADDLRDLLQKQLPASRETVAELDAKRKAAAQ